MDFPPPGSPHHDGHDVADEQEYVRSVTALTDLPGRWAGHAPGAIAPTLCDSLKKLLDADAAFVEVRHPETGAPSISARGATAQEIEAAVRREADGRPVLEATSSDRALRLMVYAVGLDGDFGRLIVGSCRKGFPAPLDWLLLQAAGNLVAVAVRQSLMELRLERTEGRAARLATARRKADASARSKSEMLAVISHEMRTPLAAIHGYAELLALETLGPLTPAQRESVTRLRLSGEYLTHLVTSTLDFSRLTGGYATYEIARVPVDEALDVATDVVRPQLGIKQLRLERLRTDGLCVAADRDKLQQIIVNLLSNAVKFTPTGGSISVRARRDQQMVRISVSDTGPGIPDDQAEAVFEPFVQVGESRRGEGTGLGLTIAREYALAMRGYISLDSGVGRGSTFTLALPSARVGESGSADGGFPDGDARQTLLR